MMSVVKQSEFESTTSVGADYEIAVLKPVPVAESPTGWKNVRATLAALQALIQASAQSAAATTLTTRSADYTLALSDANSVIHHPATDTTARTWTIPANASVAFAVGTMVTFDNAKAAGALTIAIASDTLELVGAGTTGNRTLAPGGQATAVKVSDTMWRINGVGLT